MRSSGKNNSDFTRRDYYRYYKENGGKLSYKEYSLILKTVGEHIVNYITTGMEIMLPYGVGILVVKRYKYEPRIKDGKLKSLINFGETQKLRLANPDIDPSTLKVYYDNYHTNGYVFKLVYQKKFFKFKNKIYISYIASRNIKRTLAHNIKNNNIDFNKIPIHA